MAITPYTGQPLAKGMIVCRRSTLTNGFCTRPVMIARIRGTRLYVRPYTELDEDASPVKVSTVVYIVYSWDDGMAISDASIAFVKREQERLREYARARDERQAATIEETIKARA